MSFLSSELPSAAFLITAAGSGRRMGGGVKKEFRETDGIPVLAAAVKAMVDTGLFSYGLITCTPGLQPRTKRILSPLSHKLESLDRPLLFCDGGAERQESVYLGLSRLAAEIPELYENGIVLIHDGARPWAGKDLIERVFNGCAQHGACAPVVPSIDAMKQLSEDGKITGHLPRKETVAIQTPQGFRFSKILEAHRKASEDNVHYIDDTEIYNRYAGPVTSVSGERRNRKITYSEDLD